MSRRREETDAHSDTTGGRATVVVVAWRGGGGRTPVNLSTQRRLALSRRVNEVDAALLHVEGRTHGRGGR